MPRIIFLSLIAVCFSVCSILEASRIETLKEELSLWMPRITGVTAPDTAISGRARKTDSFKTGVGQVIRKFGLHGENVRALLESTDDEIVLGYYNPDTVLVIDRDTTIYANIILLNNAQLIIRDCVFTYKGNIVATGNSRLIVEDADFILPQDYIYQFQFIVVDSAGIEYRNSRINSSLLPFGAGVTHRAFFEMDSVEMDAAFITFLLMENSRIDINHANGAGEFVVLGDSCSLHIAHSDTVLIWLGFPKNSSGEVHGSFGMGDYVESYSFPDSTCTGISYSIELDSLSGLILATMAEDSTEVVVYDADLQSCGNIFYNNWVDTISGLVDGSHYDDFSPHLPGRTLRLVNSSVKAWNLYPYENTEITLQSSIFGELCSDSLAQTTIMNATCDGMGGHVGAGGSATFIMFYSTLFTDALMERNSMSMLLYTSFVRGNLIARDRAVTLLYNTVLVNPIQVYDSAAVMEITVNQPSPAWIDDTLSIGGTATMHRGPDSPFSFEGYRMEYASVDDTTTFFPLTSIVTTPVHNSELCAFPTYGLDVGNYLIRIWYFFSAYTSHDSLCFDNSVYLSYNTGIDERGVPSDLALDIYPNPFNSVVNIDIRGVGAHRSGARRQIAEVKIFDINGRLVGNLPPPCTKSGGEFGICSENRCSDLVQAPTPLIWQPDKSLGSGIYLIRTKIDGIALTRRVLYLK
ncbi:hypothetical protein DRQ36_02415 [bacterium]|nr:MAG: hypothetical protein DRQ36_02415 [bacterium]